MRPTSPDVARLVATLLVTILAGCTSLQTAAGRALSSGPRASMSAQERGPSAAEQKQVARHRAEGVRHLRAGQWQEAVNEYAAALKLVPDDAMLWLGRGWAHAKLGNERAAKYDFEQSLRHEETVEGHHALAELAKNAVQRGDNVRTVTGAYGYARQHFQRAITMRRDDPHLHYALGAVMYLYYRSPYASPRQKPIALRYPLRAMQEAIRLKPDFTEAYLLQALVSSEMGDAAGAARAATRAIELEPENSEAYYVRGLVMSRTSERASAPAYARRALALDPGNARYARAARDWRRPVPPARPQSARPTWGQFAVGLGIALFGAFLMNPVEDGAGSAGSRHCVFNGTCPHALDNPALDALSRVGNP